MEAASSLILKNQTYKTGPINHELSGHALFFKFKILNFHKNIYIFIKLYSSHFLASELKGRPLIIIMRPTASLTRC
jgi:hypothetical protein